MSYTGIRPCTTCTLTKMLAPVLVCVLRVRARRCDLLSTAPSLLKANSTVLPAEALKVRNAIGHVSVGVNAYTQSATGISVVLK